MLDGNLRKIRSWGETMRDERRTIPVSKRACAIGAVSLVMLASTAGLVSAQEPMPPMPMEHESEAAMTHEQMHQMMDAMHGEGASERMHEAMGDDADAMMDQCTAMMNVMDGMRGMMGDDAMPGMMDEPGQGSRSDMMRRMMGR
jgi:hypothetical protein